MVKQRATSKWLFMLVIALATSSIGPISDLTTKADTAPLSFQVCRTYVEPCHQQVSIPEAGAVELDLVLSNSGDSPVQIAAWETHFRLDNSSIAQLMPGSPSGRPVQQQGDAELALEGLLPLQTSGDKEPGQFYIIQNQFDPDSGWLDYAVTLVRFDQTKSHPRVLPIPIETQLLLGRVMVKGISKGTLDIAPEDASGSPFQVVTVDPSGSLNAVAVMPLATPQATIKIGSVATAELQGQIAPPGTGNGPLEPPGVTELTVSFWRAGAVPHWRLGNDLPLATFSKVLTDASGAFRVTDIAPSLLPAGTYDLRIDSHQTLSSLVKAVTIPASGVPTAPPPLTSVSIVSLRDGDIDGNNRIDQSDLTALKFSFGRLESGSEFNANADFNGDGVIDVLDFTRMAQNFGKTGD